MRSLLLALGALAACGDNAPLHTVPVGSGRATLTLSADRTELVFARGDTTLLTFHADSFQVATVDDLDAGDSFDPYWLYDANAEPPAGFQWHAKARGAAMTATESSADRLVLNVGDLEVTFETASAGGFTVHLAAGKLARAAYFRVVPDADATEGFYGLGEWGDTVMHRGKLRAMQMELDADSESSDIEDHVPVPLLIGTRGWGMFVESRRPGTFSVARDSETAIDVTFGTGEESAAGLDVHLFSADAPLDVLADYYDVAGYPALPADWAYGPLLWRDEHRDQAQVLDDITQIRSRHLATSGVWFDRPYATGVQTFDFSPVKFPQPAVMLQALHDAGFRYGVWHAPYAAPAGNDEDPAGAQYDYAKAHGFFPPKEGVLLNPWGDLVDFTNPDAYAWWQQQLRRYTDPLPGGYGVEGFKLDYGEDVVVGLLGQRTPWLFADGSDERTMHYGYQLLYHQIHREVMPAAGGWLLTRTGRWGDQTKGMIIWPGDLDASFLKQGDPLMGKKAVGGLPTALAFGIGLSASGFPFYSSDTAGYRHSPANNECWLRWVEANAISSAMEVGDSSSQMPWEFTPENGRSQHSVDVYARYASLHMRLFPYAWTYAEQMSSTGHPLVRPFGLAHPEVGQHPSDEFLFGDALLSAPVIEAGATHRSVWFPPGAWLSWWDATVYDGGASGAQHDAPADLDTLPLFVKRGAIIPMLRASVETLAPVANNAAVDSFATDPGPLWVRVVPGAQTSAFTVYDGSRLGQTNGTALTFAPGSVFTKGALFEVIATPAAPPTVHANGAALTVQPTLAALQAAGEGWFWEAATGGTLWIAVPTGASISVP